MENNIDYDKVNDDINKLLSSDRISSLYIDNIYNLYKMSIRYNLLLLRELNNYILDNNKINIEPKRILEISSKYLGNINSNYKDELHILYNNYSINIDDNINESSTDFDLLKRKPIINIKKDNSYLDVIQLVHEFMHYTNMNPKNLTNKTRNELTEYISIYHEIMTSVYLYRNYKLKSNKLHNVNRLINTFECTSDIMNYFIPILAYMNGKIDDNSYKKLQEHNILISKEGYIDSINKYELLFSKNNYNIYKYINDSFLYVLSTYLAFYSLYNSELEDISYINDNMNGIYSNSTSLLKDINIKIDNNFENKALNNMSKYIKKYILLK